MGAGIDYTKVEPIQHKRILGYVSNFVMQSANMLNHFSNSCEAKLADVTRRIRRLEAIMAILETKLASIPGIEDVQATEKYTAPPCLQSLSSRSQNTVATSNPTTATSSTEQPVAQASAPQSAPAATLQAPAPEQAEAAAAPPAENTNTVAKDPRYKKYLQLTKVGVPVGQFAGKMRAEGLDPDLLETPDAPVPSASSSGPPMMGDNSDSSSEEESDDSEFSD